MSSLISEFVLHKINIETLDAIQRLSKCFGSRLHNFAYAGTKDKRAETWQWMTVKGKRMHELVCVRFIKITLVLNVSSL